MEELAISLGRGARVLRIVALIAIGCHQSPTGLSSGETPVANSTAAGENPPPSDKAQRRTADTTPEIVAKAREILETDSSQPIGTEVPFVLNGRRFVARFEWHDNPDGDPARPMGKHKGITVYTDD